MIDISAADSNGLRLVDSQVQKAGNILSIQLGSLEYAPDLGIDLAYFLDERYSFQNSSFKAYLVEILARQGVNISEVIDTVNDLSSQYTIMVNDDDTSTDLVAR